MKEGVEPHELVQIGANRLLLLLVQVLHEALLHGIEDAVELGWVGIGPQREVRLREGVLLLLAEEVVVRDPVLEVVEEVGVGALGEDRVLVVRLEGFADRLGLVGEVEDHGVVLGGVRPVQA